MSTPITPEAVVERLRRIPRSEWPEIEKRANLGKFYIRKFVYGERSNPRWSALSALVNALNEREAA